jgi:hemerythrin
MESEILVEWEDRYSVGIPFVDDQHKELIKLTNKLYKGCLGGEVVARAYFLTAVKGTVNYVKYHFNAEEKLMENVKFPEFAEHKRQHEDFVKQILEDTQSFQEGKKFIPNVFVRFLKDWILSHIAVLDKRYASYILNLKKQGALDETLGR